MPCFRASVTDVSVSIMVAADCGILEVLPHGADAVRQHLTPRHRITALNNVPIKDRCELRQMLNAMGPNTVVEVEYNLAFEHTKLVEIQNSVECNGAVSQLAPQHPFDATSGDEGEAEANFADLSKSLGQSLGQSLGHGTDDPSAVFRPTDSPRLLAFDEVEGMDATVRAKEAREVRMASIRQKLHRALTKVKLGSCVICVCVEVNPIAELELLAMQLQQPIHVVDLGVKLRLRPKPDAVASQLVECMRQGAWFVVTHAHKSLNTLRHLEMLVEEMRSHNLHGVHENARILLCTESHPHFPVGLTHGAVVTRVQSSFAFSSLMSVTLASLTSTACCRLVQAGYGDDGTSVQDSFNHSTSLPYSASAGAIPPPLTESITKVMAPATATFSPSTVASPTRKKRVRLSAAVDIVDIEPREIMTGVMGTSMKSQSGRPIDVSGSVALRSTFGGILNDKFLCIKNAGDPGRFAVGSSLGNLYFLDEHGASLLQVHAHDACIWDVSFRNKYDFATGSEDGSAAQWNFSAAASDAEGETPLGQEETETSLEQRVSSLLGADVYCVAHVHQRSDLDSPVVAGGLANQLLLQTHCAPACGIATPSNCQVICAFRDRPTVLVGGGDGSVAFVDIHPSGGSIVRVLQDHSRKVPTLTIRDANQFFTGSFDSTIRAWDHRDNSCHATHTLKLKNYVTGLSVDDMHLAASVGENLYLWDVRKLNEVLGGYPQGWKGLSRGIVIQSERRLVVTASPDGNVRFWNFV